MIPYPREFHVPCPLCVIALGGLGSELVDLSLIGQDYPVFRGVTQFRSRRFDSDASRVFGRDDAVLCAVPDGQRIRENPSYYPALVPFMRADTTYASSTSGARSMPEGYLAAVNSYERIYKECRAAIMPLARLSKKHLADRAIVRLAFVSSGATNSGPGMVPVILEVGQRFRSELARHGVNVERTLFVVRPSVDDRERRRRSANAAALDVSLSIAQASGLPVAPGRTLRGPIAELPVAYGARLGSLEDFEQQKRQAAATLRALLHPDLAQRVRAVLRRAPELVILGDSAQIARPIGYATLGLDRAAATDLLTDIALSETDHTMTTTVTGGAS